MRTEFVLRRKISFFNILKWFLASFFIGVVVGIFNAAFLKLLGACIKFTNSFNYYFLLLPLGLYVSNYLARKVAADDTDFSTNDAIAAINEKRGISLISSLKSFFLPIVTIACGGSAGKESPCADVGAGAASFFADLFSFNKNERRKLMICGVSAGFAGVFGVPISGALFGLEVLSVGTVFYEVMFPAFIAGITSYQVTQLMGVEYVYHALTLGAINITDSSLLSVIFGGVFFGLVSLFMIEVLKIAQILFRFIAVKYSVFLKCLVAGLLIIVLALLTSPTYLGLSMMRVDAILAGDTAAPFGFLFKIIATALTFAGGGVGGLITPVFFIGANAGYFFGNITGFSTATFAALGVVSVLAGVANTPLAASVMAIELFGASIAPYAAVSCIVSFLVTGRRSIYPKQRFSFDKDLSDDEIFSKTEMKQSIRQLERKLEEKNFILAMVKHLIPQFKKKKKASSKNPSVKKPAQKIPAAESDESKQKENKERKPKKENTLFGHLFPSVLDENTDGSPSSAKPEITSSEKEKFSYDKEDKDK